ncbi:N-acetylmannosamine-6-phosphate 2-epimerase [Loigolactobacillus coryniformis subsp. torquens DSM 20004 = KCTC 3535]|jgi:N-acylglucosamine-6-phosphate 2-epimerase|nr:N-acetylmannosamine-6-phosphate 2-epimerase [Loigolactobacillus coryniformis subsp. torquens DSM 20004 = KCTC 3535]
MALAAKEAGAAGIRANSIVDIQAIQDEVDLPVIGLNKVDYPDSPVYITPTIKEMRAVAATGCAAVACDVTGQPRPNGEKLADIVATMRAEFPDTLLMADTDTLENVRLADELGFDIIGTTMHGYTPATKGANIADDDFAYLKAVLKTTSHPVIAEGKVDTPAKMKRCLDLGCHAVVVGGAITRPLQIAKNFIDAL